MKKCLLYGNCQVMAIKHNLEKNPNFVAEYENIVAIDVQAIAAEDVSEILELVKEVDLFIYQPVKESARGLLELRTDYLRSQLKSDCQVITIGEAYFTGYHPEVIIFKDAQGNNVTEEVGEHHDFNLLKLFAGGKTVEESVELILREDFYSPHYLNCNLDHVILELYRQDTQTDIKIAPFIQKHYRRHRLFQVINQPQQVMIEFISNEICRRLGITYDEQQNYLFTNEPEILDSTSFAIYPSVVKNLNLKFAPKSEYKINQNLYTVSEAVEKFFDYYNRHRDLVALNLERYGEYYRITNIARADCEQRAENKLVAADSVTDAIPKPKTVVTSSIKAETNPEQLPQLKSFKQCLEMGDAAQANQKWQPAINYYQKAIELNPNLEEKTYLKLKQAQRILGHTEDSIATYKAWILRNYLVEHQSKFIYCPIPGNAHHLVKKILLESSADGAKFQESKLNVDRYINQNKDKFYLSDFEELNNSDYFKFAILRNTYQKLVSVYFDLFVKQDRHTNKQINSIIKDVQQALDREIDLKKSITFEQLVDYLAISKDRDLDARLRSQSIYLAPELIQFDYIGCFEQLDITIDYLKQKLAKGEEEVNLNINIDKQQKSKSSATDKQLEKLHNWYPAQLTELVKPPVTAQFYPAQIQEKVSYRYARDITMYEQYFDTVITPFD